MTASMTANNPPMDESLTLDTNDSMSASVMGKSKERERDTAPLSIGDAVVAVRMVIMREATRMMGRDARFKENDPRVSGDVSTGEIAGQSIEFEVGFFYLGLLRNFFETHTCDVGIGVAVQSV